MRWSIRSSRTLLGYVLNAVLAGALSMAGAVAMAQPGKPGTPPPSLTGFSPAQGAQGTAVTMTFTGNDFGPKGLGLQFFPASGLTVQKLQALSATQIQAHVQIDASAPLGARQVMLTVSDRRLPTQLPFTVTGSAACGLPGQPPCSPQHQEGPALKGFSPLASRQGTSVTVVFTGSRFASPAQVEFSPGAGITVQSTRVINAGKIEAQLVIDPNAPLGARKVSLLVGKTQIPAEKTFTVAESAAMEILRLVPNQIPAGSQNFDLTLEGKNFVPGTIVSFAVGNTATDIFVVGAPQYINSTEMHVTVNVLPTALPGGRDIHLEAPNQQSVTVKGMLNISTP
jgi:hypothetical protein